MSTHLTQTATGEVQPVEPVLPGPGGSTAKLPHSRNDPFVLRFHPFRWQLIGDRWLPQLAQRPITPGVSHVDEYGDPTMSHTRATQRGWTTLHWQEYDYLRAYPASGGHLHVMRWERPRTLGGRPISSVIDHDGYHEWLASLIDEGRLPDIDPAVVEQQIDAQRMVTEELRRHGDSPALQEAEDLLQRMLATVSPSTGKSSSKSSGKSTGKSTGKSRSRSSS